jgi:hypothetical protein
MNCSSAIIVVTTLALSQVEPRDPPDRPERPFRVFVSAETQAEQEVVGRIRKAKAECEKIVKRRKNWFIAVDRREQAEIVLEIEAYFLYEELRTESSPLSGTPVNVTRENHQLFAEVDVLGSSTQLRVDDSRRLTGAASKLIDALEEFCKKNYWTILSRRAPPSPGVRGVR